MLIHNKTKQEQKYRLIMKTGVRYLITIHILAKIYR